MKSKFDLGERVTTQGVADMLNDPKVSDELLCALGRYKNCDWGNTSKKDKAINDEAVQTGYGRTVGAYITSQGEIWIITDFGDKDNITTVLLPEEYLRFTATPQIF